MPVSLEVLKAILRNASVSKLTAYAPHLNEAMQRFGMVTRNRAAPFIAQLAHESGEFRWMEEIWGPTAQQKKYEPPSTVATSLGNTQKGDGLRFKGRGPIQITGRANYKRYGELLGVDLLQQPELAALPEWGFKTAGLFWDRNGLNTWADKDDLRTITKRINGGLNGLEERTQYYERAKAVLQGQLPDSLPAGLASQARRGPSLKRGAETLESEPASEPKAVTIKPWKDKGSKKDPTERICNMRPDTTDFRDQLFVPTLIEVPAHIPLGNYLDAGVPILDQGTEGACTGFGLATVVHYLLRTRKVIPDPCHVSPRMLYLLARRYDEWPGEDYSGSSARGAMKGWHKHGVCSEELFPYAGGDGQGLTQERTSDALRRPLGAYFRVNHQELVAMHTAIAEAGILYATCMVHEGWQDVGPDGHIELSDKLLGGHAFAIVAYDELGFWLQNSWGDDWGCRGFAHISYDDWLRNGTDVWVARLVAPVTLQLAESTACAHAATAGESIGYAFADLRPHIISVGNDGLLRPGGDYGTTREQLRHIFETDIPRVAQDWKKLRILLYAHGGLVDEASAVQRLADYRPGLLASEVYPLAFIWKTDAWTTLKNMLQDVVRRRRPEGVLDAAKDFMLDRLDDALEPLARLPGRAFWREMKENARLAAQPGDTAQGLPNGAVVEVVQLLVELVQSAWVKSKKLEIHLVGHSAGAILHAGVIDRMMGEGLPIESCTLWAPACTMKLFRQSYMPALKKTNGVRRLNLYVLSDKAEQDDDCAKIYNKSLLYLVSHSFEDDNYRIPFTPRAGEPILGMEAWLNTSSSSLPTRCCRRQGVHPRRASMAPSMTTSTRY